MKAVYFKFTNEEGDPTGWVGFAFARTIRGIYWQIDQYGDPSMCLIKPAQCGSFCYTEENQETMDDDFEFCDELGMALLESEGWQKPEWKNCGRR
jgi:hypothetical protein